MRPLALVATAMLGLMPIATHAADRPVVVELFTSQGCSSCPPADRYMHELVKSDDVIGLSWHVDYWDYIGWKDVFASPEFTNRQRYYAQAMDERMIYTPQMVINGEEHAVGSDRTAVTELLMKHGKSAPEVELVAAKNGGSISIEAEFLDRPSGRFDVHLVQYSPSETVKVLRGENAGETLTYTNVVRAWQDLGNWNGRRTLNVDADIDPDLAVVVMIQEANYGTVVAAVDVQ